jgi:hypothetical protein
MKNSNDTIRNQTSDLPIILVRFYWNLRFPDRFSKNIQVTNFMKISRSILLRMRNVPDNTENQNTHFKFNNFCFPQKSCCVWDNVQKIWYSRISHNWQYTAKEKAFRNFVNAPKNKQITPTQKSSNSLCKKYSDTRTHAEHVGRIHDSTTFHSLPQMTKPHTALSLHLDPFQFLSVR